MKTITVRLLVDDRDPELGTDRLMAWLVINAPAVLGGVELVSDGFSHMVPDCRGSLMVDPLVQWNGDEIT